MIIQERPMTTMMATHQPLASGTKPAKQPHQNEAVAHARLELLSNTAMLKKVMDNQMSNWKQQQKRQVSTDCEERKNSTMDVTPQSKQVSTGETSPKPMEKEGHAPVNKTVVATEEASSLKHNVADSPPIKTHVAEKSSSTPVTIGSPQQQAVSTPTTATTTVTSPPSSTGSIIGFVPSSYSSLLLPAGVHVPPPPAGYGAHHHHHQQFQANLAALAHLPPDMKTAMAMVATANKMMQSYGGPSSAFQKPYVLIKETVPPVPVTASPSMDSRHGSPTHHQSPGEGSTREGVQFQPQLQRGPSYELLLQENIRLQRELKKKDETIASLQTKANGLEKQIFELRQLPTGKISHIPIEDMIRIMQEYGSEVSNQTLPKRKQPIQKASIVRQFRRWNPEFFRYFVHVNGEWVPRLGKEGELKRRVEKRRSLQKSKGAASPDSTKSSKN